MDTLNTPFMEIYEIFLNKITDFNICDLTDEEFESFCCDLMISALPKINPLTNDLSSINIEDKTFNTSLLSIEKELIAIQMVAEWIEPQLNSTSLIRHFIGSKEEKFYAQSTHIKELQSLLEIQEARARKLRRDYQYRNFKL